FMNLHGNLERTVQLKNGTADLLSTGDLTFIVVNVAEISKRIRAADLPWTYFQECRPQNDTYLLTLGSRYASVSQSWHATLRDSTTTLASSDATQSFAGLGVSAAFDMDRPWSGPWGWYFNTRWSLLIGPNNRKSTVSGQNAAGPFTNTLIEN